MKLKLNSSPSGPTKMSSGSSIKKFPVGGSPSGMMDEINKLPPNSPPVILREWSRDDSSQDGNDNDSKGKSQTPSPPPTLLREWSKDDEEEEHEVVLTPPPTNNNTKNEPSWVSAIFPSADQITKTTTTTTATTTIDSSVSNDDETTPDIDTSARSTGTTEIFQKVKKAGVSVVGSAMVGVGLVMIPLPTPCGVVVAGSGLAVLGTEYPAAQKVLEDARDTLVDAIETNIIEKEEEEEGEEKQSDDKQNTTFENSVNNDDDDEFEIIPSMTPVTENDTSPSSSTRSMDFATASYVADETTDTTKIIDTAAVVVSKRNMKKSNSSDNLEYKPTLRQLKDEILLASNPEECKEKTSILLGEIGSRIKRNASNIGKKVVPVLKSIGTTTTTTTTTTTPVTTTTKSSAPEAPPPVTETTTTSSAAETIVSTAKSETTAENAVVPETDDTALTATENISNNDIITIPTEAAPFTTTVTSAEF